MAIYQTNLWVCEVCHKQVPVCKEVGAYDDPVVTYPPGGEWEFILVDGKEVQACPACTAAAVKPDTRAGATLVSVNFIHLPDGKAILLHWSDGRDMISKVALPCMAEEVSEALTRLYIPLRREVEQ